MPKTANGLFEQIVDFGNMYESYLRARAGKRYRREVLKFSTNLEEELLRLQAELRDGKYRTGRYRHFQVFEPKKREISALPFRDRVVHHAVCAVVEPLMERKFIADSYACRVGRGTHAASDRTMEFLRAAKRQWPKVYCLKADIQKFFQSIDHAVLKAILRRTVRCKRTLALLDEIIDSAEGAKGLPIGNLTSQLFANTYLNELDHFIKESLGVRFYVRYLDDFVILLGDKPGLHDIRFWVEGFLRDRLTLTLNAKTSIFPVERGIDFVGYRTWATHRLIRKRSIIGMKRKLKHLTAGFKTGAVTLQRVHTVIASWLGHAKHANSHNLVTRLLYAAVFTKGQGGME